MSSSAYPVIWALKHAPVVDTEERAIVLALADHGDADGCNCFPSVPTMARIALVSESTVKRKLRALKARGVIRPQPGPPPARWKALPPYRRSAIYELMIPYSWWSDAQREEVDRMRADRGRGPLTPGQRPDLTPAPPRKTRSDKGKPAPQRRPKSLPPKTDDSAGQSAGASGPPVSETGGIDPVDNSDRGVLKTPHPRSSRPPTPGLQDPQPSCLTLLSHPPEELASDLSSRSAQVGDARRRVTAPQAASGEPKGSQSTEDTATRPPERPQSAEGARDDQRAAPVADRPSGRRSASQDARRVLGALPRAFRDGAPRWVLAEMAVRVDALLADGRTPVEIVRAAEVVPPPIGPRGHMDALHAVRAALRTNGYDRQADEVAAGVVRCEGCGARRTGAVPCTTCDPVEVLEVIELTDVGEGQAAALG